MSLRITKIEIKNFRSIRNLSISPAKLSVFVGKNDCGKSNILRALNLFFNNHTNPEEPLNFNVDHNVFNQPNRKAKEISIKLDIALPKTYQSTNGDFIVWEKRWRREGLLEVPYIGKRKNKGPRGGDKLVDVEIPKNSNVHTLLRNINFVYVPAIKDLEYFAQLRARIFDVIAESAAEFRKSSRAFEESIANHLQELTGNISKALGLTSRLALPRDLSHVFESLDFLSGEQQISLDARGDGIKARHIPMILKFMADKKRNLHHRGAMPHNFIWGYEEPENNLEFASCIKLADQFCSFINDGISQIFLTTHSPVFYNLRHKNAQHEGRISSQHVFQENDESGTQTINNPGDIDERMGTMAAFAPMAQELERKIRGQEKAKAEALALADELRPKLFVEGPTDKLIIEKVLDVFAPDHAGEIDVKTKDDGGGYNYVIDMLRGWYNVAKHNADKPKAAGLVDQDEEALEALREFNCVSEHILRAKCFKLPEPPYFRAMKKAGFKVPIDLELIYDSKAWLWAEHRGHLVDRNLPPIITNELNQRIINGNTVLKEHLEKKWEIFVLKKFSQAGKLPMARHFANKSEDEIRTRLPFLESLVSEIVDYLFPETKAESSKVSICSTLVETNGSLDMNTQEMQESTEK